MPIVLVSVSDKTGLIDFANRLRKKDFSFIASGGTAAALKAAGIPVTEAAEYTKSPEILGGRVKTLHPIIHAGILARPTGADKEELSKLNINEIDMVVTNLYPFEKTIAKENVQEQECIENIDIGGVALLRAAAKNYERVTVICNPDDYDEAAAEIESFGAVRLQTRKQLAVKAFELCTRYDAAITSWLSSGSYINICGFNGKELRYGENPHQKAQVYSTSSKSNILGGRIIQGKELSYNNILDSDAAWKAVSFFKNPAAVVVKHLTPCGIAELGGTEPETELAEALKAAIACDSVSAYGGIIAVNRTFDEKCFYALGNLFVECLIAPAFSDGAKKLLAGKKNCRIIEEPSSPVEKYEFRSVTGGILRQEQDKGDLGHAEYKNAAKRAAGKNEIEVLKFAWKACVLVKSNAILLAAPIDPLNPSKGMCSVGIGCGQPNRIDAARHAICRASAKAKGAVLASDAFFPFPDTVAAAAEAGITAVIQPGGSIHDDLSIAECDKNNMAMIFTGFRHFKH